MEDFISSSSLRKTFWIKIRDLPLNCWAEAAFRRIGSSLGQVEEVDVTEARVRVSVDVTKPRYCSNCRMISHEERDCPLLTELQRQVNPRIRHEDRTVVREDTVPGEKRRRSERDLLGIESGEQRRRISRARYEERAGARINRVVSAPEALKNTGVPLAERETSSSRRNVRRNLYQSNDFDNGKSRNPVWQRLGTERAQQHPRTREQSIQSSSNPHKRREEVSSGKGSEIHNQNHKNESRSYRESHRRREEPLRIIEPREEEASRENGRGSHRPPRYQNSRNPDDRTGNQIPQEKSKGKGKVVEDDEAPSEDEEMGEEARKTNTPTNFEVGSGSGTGVALTEHHVAETDEIKEPPLIIAEGDKASEDPIFEAEYENYEEEYEEWDEENEGLFADDNPMELGEEDGTVLSDWEQIAEDGIGSEKELTVEELQTRADMEKVMILDELLNDDDLLGEELMEAEQEAIMSQEESLERTISESVAPIEHPLILIPATSQSPMSKRCRSPVKEKEKLSKNQEKSERLALSPHKKGNGPSNQKSGKQPVKKEAKATDLRKKIPISPSVLASKKLKIFHGKSSPKKRGDKAAAGSTQISPLNEEAKNKKKKESKATTPKDGPAEAENSPDLPK